MTTLQNFMLKDGLKRTAEVTNEQAAADFQFFSQCCMRHIDKMATNGYSKTGQLDEEFALLGRQRPS